MVDSLLIKYRNVLVILFIIVLAFAIFQYISYDKLKHDYNTLNYEFSIYKEKTSIQITNLSSNYDKLSLNYMALNYSYNALNDKYQALNVKYSNLTNIYTDILDKIDQYQRNITEFMNWLSENSKIYSIRDVSIQKTLSSRLNNYCIQIVNDTCTIKTGCLFLTNSKWLELTYENSSLSSLEEFLTHKSGDCKDFSLLFKAEMNYLLERCESLGATNVVLESYKISNIVVMYDSGYQLDFSIPAQGWYIRSGYAFNLTKGYIYPVIVCGNLFDPNTNNISGHCMVAFTRNKISSVDNIRNLLGAPIVEPQTGEFVGTIYDETSPVETSQTWFVYRPNYQNISLMPNRDYSSFIFIVITDSDIMLFDEASNSWISYSLFYHKLSDLRIKAINSKTNS